MGLYMAEDLARSVGITEAEIGTVSGSPKADTTDTTA